VSWEWATDVWRIGWASALIVAVGSILVAWIVEVAIIGILRRIASRTASDLDDKVLELLKRPIYVSVLLFGFDWSLHRLGPHDNVARLGRAALVTVAIAFWTVALMRLSRVVLRAASQRKRVSGILQAQTLPLFDILVKTGVMAAAIYMTMVAWHINVGAWLASAGVVGVAVGLAAQDSLANYFAGVFIIADAPYKLHDIITLSDGTRGRVTDIGLRSTRIHTKDGVEINIPNSVLGSMQIENRSAGPGVEERISVEVGVAYGSDMAAVIEVLRETAKRVDNVHADREPEIYFKAFGASSLDLDVKVWIRPIHFEQVRHDLHSKIYDALNEAGIEIPFPQQDVHVKEIPAAAGV